jgi:predicted transposase/invertase (TIGR01784 family)
MMSDMTDERNMTDERYDVPSEITADAVADGTVRATENGMFKFLFGRPEHSHFTLDLLNTFLAHLGPFHSLVLLNVELKKVGANRKGSLLDLLFEVDGRLLVNIEMQRTRSRGDRRRMVRYLSKVYGGQLRPGQRDSRAKPVVTLVIADFIQWPSWPHVYTVCPPLNTASPNTFDGNMELNYVELSKALLPEYAFLNNPRELQWAGFLAATTRAQRAFYANGDPIMTEVLNVMDRYPHLDELRELMDERNWHLNNLQERMQEAREDGIEEGEARGKAEALVHSIRTVLDVRDISLLPQERSFIDSCTDAARLDAMLKRSLTMKPGDRLLLN